MPHGLKLDNNSNHAYSYDAYGRLSGINVGANAFAYTRLSNSVLIETLTRPNSVNTTWSFEANRNLVSSVANGTMSTYGYVNDDIGRRTSMSRRIEKKVMSGESVVSLERFVYDNYKQIERLDGSNSNAVLQKFVWSGETLLCLIDATNSTTHYYLQDANKNITELLDGNGNLTAHYEYSPFGKTSVLSGSYSTSNPFRFSSEFVDDETSLVYYNYRYYSPELGRWLSKDPIEEQGGNNLYNMIANNPANKTDYLGKAWYEWVPIVGSITGMLRQEGERVEDFADLALLKKDCPRNCREAVDWDAISTKNEIACATEMKGRGNEFIAKLFTGSTVSGPGRGTLETGVSAGVWGVGKAAGKKMLVRAAAGAGILSLADLGLTLGGMGWAATNIYFAESEAIKRYCSCSIYD